MRACGVFMLLLWGAGQASAQANTQTDTQDNAQVLVQQAANQAIDALQKSRAELERNPEKIYDFVQEYLLPYFDFDYASRLVLGRHWRQASEDERVRFRDAFQRTLIRSYASSMLKYSDQKINFLPYRETPNSTDTTVKTEIPMDSGKPVAVDYNLHRDDDGEWKVYDVIIDGISVVVNYRGTFTSEIKRLNGLSPLIERMEERNRQGLIDPAPDNG